MKHVLFGAQEGVCNLCSFPFEYRILEVDHVIPKAKGDHIENRQLLCPACNKMKGTGTMEEATVQYQEIYANSHDNSTGQRVRRPSCASRSRSNHTGAICPGLEADAFKVIDTCLLVGEASDDREQVHDVSPWGRAIVLYLPINIHHPLPSPTLIIP